MDAVGNSGWFGGGGAGVVVSIRCVVEENEREWRMGRRETVGYGVMINGYGVYENGCKVCGMV
jgi:hypothetical protein